MVKGMKPRNFKRDYSPIRFFLLRFEVFGIRSYMTHALGSVIDRHLILVRVKCLFRRLQVQFNEQLSQLGTGFKYKKGYMGRGQDDPVYQSFLSGDTK